MSDLIDRQNAINAMMALKQEDDERYGCEIPEGFDGKRAIEALEKLPSAAPERTAKVTLLITGLHSVWGTCECGRQVEKPGRNDQSGAYYCPRCGAKLEWE